MSVEENADRQHKHPRLRNPCSTPNHSPNMSSGPMCNITDSQFWKERVASERKAQPLDADGKPLPRKTTPAVAPCPWATEDIVMGVPPAYLKDAGASTKRPGSRAPSVASVSSSRRSARSARTNTSVRSQPGAHPPEPCACAREPCASAHPAVRTGCVSVA
jgi:hypothetical protein